MNPCKRCILYASCRTKYLEIKPLSPTDNYSKGFALYNLANDCSLFKDYICYILDIKLPNLSSPSGYSNSSIGHLNVLLEPLCKNIKKFDYIFGVNHETSM